MDFRSIFSSKITTIVLSILLCISILWIFDSYNKLGRANQRQAQVKEYEEQKSKIFKLESDIQSKDKQIEEYKVEVNELKDLTKIAEEKARVAEQMSSKFQNDAYRVQLEKIEIENELKFYKATR